MNFKKINLEIDLNKCFQSKKFKAVILTIAAVIILLLVLMVGMFVGFKKATFSYQWGENYHQNFAGPKEGFFKDFGGRDFIEPHGIFGQILKIDGSTLIINDRDEAEKIVLVKENTIINRFRETVKVGDLKVGDYVVIIGDPNNAGQVEANLIRIMPAPPQSSSGAQNLPPSPMPTMSISDIK